MRCKKIILLFLGTVIGTLLWGTKAEAITSKEEPLAVIYSASDFQNPDGHEQGAKELEAITKQIYDSGNQEISEALICGDYYDSDNLSEDESAKGIDAIYEVLNRQWQLEYDEILYVQGNHDPSGTSELDPTGGIEREFYNIYQINHADYMWSNEEGVDIESRIYETAETLRRWLNEKVKAGDSKPVFVITHLPLHHTYRYDNPYSEYLFDVLNEAGASGLNIVYIFGHNHSKEYDNYLGGSAIYLSKGEEILIPDIQGKSAEDYKTECLNFTYLNAGYIGKVSAGMLSSCIFEIYEDRVEIKRYTRDGLYNLKDSGSSSQKDLGWSENTMIKNSPQIVYLNQGTAFLENVNDSEKVFIDVNETFALKLKVQNLVDYKIIWESRDSDVAELTVDKTDVASAKITGKKYGDAQITVTVVAALDEEQILSTQEIKVLVVPEDAVCLSFGKGVRFYGLVENMSEELSLPENMENDYIISNSDKNGSVDVFAAQANEYVGTAALEMIYVPGIGNVLTETKEKNVLWRFRNNEEFLDTEGEYQIQISPKSVYRGRYYLAVTSGVDSGLGYPNLTNMRTASKSISAGTAVFRLANDNRLLTTHHYKDVKKEHGNGAFYFTFDDLNQQFVLSSNDQSAPVYFYGRVPDKISEIVMWTDAEAGKVRIGDDRSKQTGGVIHIMHEGNVEEIPIELGMLSGIEENKSGKYRCQIIFNGEVINDNYELHLKNNWFGWLKHFIEGLI